MGVLLFLLLFFFFFFFFLGPRIDAVVDNKTLSS